MGEKLLLKHITFFKCNLLV